MLRPFIAMTSALRSILPENLAVVLIAASCASLMGSPACQEATAIVFQIDWDEPCRTDKRPDPPNLRVYVERDTGSDGGKTLGPFGGEACREKADGASYGTIVVVPNDRADERVRFRAVLGVAKNAEACESSGDWDGCIVARRVVSFVKHRTIWIHVPLHSACDGERCDSKSTCVASGLCASAAIDDAEPCADGCYESALPGAQEAPAAGGGGSTGFPMVPAGAGGASGAGGKAGTAGTGGKVGGAAAGAGGIPGGAGMGQ